MRVSLSSRGSRGDVEPLVGLAVQLQALGAETAVFVPQDKEFVDLLAGAGVPHVPVGGSMRDLVTDVGGKLERLRKDFLGDAFQSHAAEIILDTSSALMAAAEDGCDAIVATGLFPGSAAAQAVAERLGVHFVHVNFQPTTLPSHMHSPYPMPGWPLPEGITDTKALWEWDIRKFDTLFGPTANAFRESIGLEPVTNIRDRVLTDRPWLATDPVLSPWEPTDADVVQTGAWILPNQRPLPADLEAFLNTGEPPVYVGFGSMPMKATEDAARIAVEAARAHGRRLVLLSGWAGLAAIDDGDDCFVTGGVNQQALFPRVAAIVHHGGAGTTTTAARSGSPQVVVPQIVDQPYWARRVAELGVGAAHDGPVATTESLTAALGTALAPQTRDRAREVGAVIRTDGAAVAAKLLLDEIA